ncbi:MAG: C4-dicarboxylate ABC transporter permease, partial [Pseudomonadota bacterium]|nr:C4-dicarboxylate ABC transporter permease [Pseudomonadota bacterium]
MSTGNRWATWAIMAVGAGMSVYHLWVAFFGTPDAQVFRSIHLLFALVLAFLSYPLLTRQARDNPGPAELLLVVASLLACGYQFWAKDYIDNRMIYVDDLVWGDWVFGGLMIVLVLEGTRRMLGLVLPVTALIFIVYALLFTSTTPAALMEQLYLTTDGIL